MAESKTDQDIYLPQFSKDDVSSKDTQMAAETKLDVSTTEEASLSSCPDLEPEGRGYTASTEQLQAVENVLKIYRELIEFVGQEEFDLDLKTELNTAFKGKESLQNQTLKEDTSASEEKEEKEANRWEYLDEFKMRMDDLKRMECGLAITGEVSSGKTSLINKIVGETLVTPKHLAATSKIVQIVNSDEFIFRARDAQRNVVKEKRFENFSEMRKMMDEYTNIRKKKRKFTKVNHIEACCPFLKLQVKENVMLVDTPGIGESAELTKMLLQYLPNAVAFIFVIDVLHAGGVQNDRLLRILETIIQQKSSMPCFEPENVLFVTNKWNNIHEALPLEVSENEDKEEDNGSDDDEDEDEDSDDQRNNKSEKEKVWDDIESKLKKVWPSLDMTRVFKLNLKNVSEEDDTEEEKMEFERFCNTLCEILKGIKNKRVLKHLSLLEETTSFIERGVVARIYTATCDDADQAIKLQNTLEKMKYLNNRCKEIVNNLKREIAIAVSGLTETIMKRLHSAEGKEFLLNPPGRKRIEKCFLLGTEIPNRVQDGIMKWMMSEEVSNEIDEIEKKISDYFQEIHLDLDEAYDNITGENRSKKEKVEAVTVIKYVATAPIWLPLCILFGALSLAAVVVLSPLILIGLAVRSSKIKQFEIDQYYRSCLAVIRKVKFKSLWT